jgi:two-component system phosphate regulon sensor histidine kinase PhoR
MLTSAKNDEKAKEKFLHIVQEQTNYMTSLIENLLSLSKIDLTLNNPPTEKISLNNIIKEISAAHNIKLKNNNLNIITKFARIPQVIGDQSQLTQVFQNLIDNAIKYAIPNTDIKITTSKVSQIPPHRYYDVKETEAIKISFTNYSTPIAKEDLERLTERFYRLQSHKNQNIKGTGLGLAIVSQIIKRHLGNMTISSKDNLTEFSVYIPIKQ